MFIWQLSPHKQTFKPSRWHTSSNFKQSWVKVFQRTRVSTHSATGLRNCSAPKTGKQLTQTGRNVDYFTRVKFSLLILLLRCSNKTTQVFYMYICIRQSMCIPSYISTRYSLLISHVPLGASEVVSSGKDNKVWQRPGLTGDEYKNSAGELNNIFVTQRFNCSFTFNMQYWNVCGFTR
jgi:hypothetical protein